MSEELPRRSLTCPLGIDPARHPKDSRRIDLRGSAQTIDVRFDEFVANDVAMVRRIYHVADQPFTTAVEAAMRAYMADHPQGRHGRINYHAEDVGLDRSELERRFRFYAERFLSA